MVCKAYLRLQKNSSLNPLLSSTNRMSGSSLSFLSLSLLTCNVNLKVKLGIEEMMYIMEQA